MMLDNDDDDEVEGALNGGNDQQSGSKSSFLSMSFYQHFFNVSTATVLSRIRRVFLFRLNGAFTLLDLEPFPDMAGPVWILITVWLASVVCSDIGDRFADPGVSQDFSRIAIGLAVVVANAVASLAGLFIVTSGQKVIPVGFPSGSSQSSGNTAHLLALFGYALTPFIPATLLCILPWSPARWTFLIVAALFTSLFLAHDLYFIVPNKIRFLVVSIYLVFIQILFCVALQYFVMGHTFSSQNDSGVSTTIAVTTSNVSPTSLAATAKVTNKTG